MSNIFKNYEVEEIFGKVSPDNRNKKLKIEKEYWDNINIGGSNYYSYILSFEDESIKLKDISNVIITYSQGTEIILDNLNYDINEYEISLKDHIHYYCKIDWQLDYDKSILFNDYNKNTYAQIKTILNNGDIILSPLLKHRLNKALKTTIEDYNLIIPTFILEGDKNIDKLMEDNKDKNIDYLYI